MKNQHKNQWKRLRIVTMTVLLVSVLVACFCGLSLISSADTVTSAGVVESFSFAEDTGISYDAAGKYWAKTYDGESAIAPEKVVLKVVGQTEDNAPSVISAGFIAANTQDAQAGVGIARVRIVYEWNGEEMEFTAPARIEKKLLTWKDVSLAVGFTYDPETGVYNHTFTDAETSALKVSALEGVAAADAEKLSIGAVNAISVTATDAVGVLTSGEALRIYTSAVLMGEAAPNYALENIEVKVNVAPYKITEVIWGIDGVAAEDAFVFSYGDADAYLITAIGKIGENDYRELIVKVKGADVTLPQADEATYGAASETPYVLYAESANPEFYVLDGAFETNVTVNRAECVISVSDIVFQQDAEHEPEFYYFPIQNPDNNVPASVFTGITYKYTLDGENFVNLPSVPGVYTVHFALNPADEANYTLKVVEEGENTDGVVRVTLLPYRLMAGVAEGGADVIIYPEAGDLLGIKATVTLAEDIPEKALRFFSVYRGIALRLSGTEATDVLKMILPVHSDLFSDANTFDLTADDLYVYDGKELKPAKDLYTVTLSEDGSYYTVSGIAANGTSLELTLLIAPEYNVSFWATAPGIALIVFLILLFVLALVLVGLALLRAEKRGENPILKLDPNGKATKEAPAEVPEKLGSAEECIEDGLNAMEKDLDGAVSPENAEAGDADATEEVAEAMGQTLTEAAAIRMTDDSEQRDIEDAERLTEEMAEDKAENFLENEAPEAAAEVEPDAEKVEEAVSEVIDEALDEARAEPAVEAMANADGVEETADLREGVDAMVAEALAATVQLPDGLREIEPVEIDAAGDVRAQVESSVNEAFRAICEDGEQPILNDGVDADAIAKAVEDAAGSAPKNWDAETVQQVKDALTEVLKAQLLK